MPDPSSDMQLGTISVSQKQTWHNLLKNGELNKVIEHVEPFLTAGEQEELSLTLIAGLASFLQNKSSSEVDCKSIHTLFCLCCKSLKIKELTELKYRFLVSSHHVLRFFIVQGHIEEALSVSSHILKTKKSDLDDNGINVYYSNFYHLHSAAVTKIKAFNERSTKLSCMLEIMNHALGHLRYCGSKFLCMLLEKAKVIPLKLSEEQDKLCLTEFHLNILERSHKGGVEPVSDVNIDELVISYMGLMTTIVKDYISMKKFADVQFAINSTVSAIRSWLFDDAVIKGCTEFLQTMLNILTQQSYCFKDVQKCLKDLALLSSKYRKSKTFYSVCVVISQVTSHMYWRSNSSDDGGMYNLEPASQKAVYELLLQLSEVISKCEAVECQCRDLSDEICVIKSDAISSFQLKTTLLHCILTSVINKVDGLETLLPLTDKVLQSAATRVSVLKEKNCAKWLEMWKLTGKKSIQLASYCFVAQMYKETKEILKRVVFITLQFGDEAISALEENGNHLTRGLEYLMDSYRKLDKLRGALQIAAIAFKVLPPRSRKNMFKNWVKIKNACADNLKKYTLYDIYTQDKEQIKLFCQDFDINTVDMAELLVLELEAYDNLGAMNLECIKAAYTTLLTLPSVDWVQKARALLVYCPFVWRHHTLKECRNTIASLNEVIEGVSSMENMEGKMLCVLGNLYFCKFCCEMKAARLKQQQDISCCNLDTPSGEGELGEMPDPNDKCDVTPTYLQLNIENESNVLKHLKCALKSWTEALCKGYNKDDGYTPLKNMEVASYLFRLYGYDSEVISTWCLYWKFSQTLGDADATLNGLYHLLEYCTCQTSKCALLAAAEAVFSEMKIKEKEDMDSQLSYLNLYLACAQHCFTNKHYTMLPTYLEVLNDAVNNKKIKTVGGFLVNARITFLITQCKVMSDPYIHWPGRTNLPAVKEAKEAYLCCSYLLEQSFASLAEYLQIQCLMLEVSLWMGQLFLEMLWPRESRCFMRKLLQISQSLSLATRTAQFLDLLAQVDVICSQVDDGVVKLQGLQLILQLENNLEDSSSSSAVTEYIDTELATCLEQLTIERSQTSEFLRSTRMRVRSPKGVCSPLLRKATFTMPRFMYHDDNCNCPMCNTLMLQNLVLDTVYLQAQIYNIQSETREAVKYFIGGIHMREMLSQKHNRWMKRFHSELQSISSDKTIVNLKPHDILLPGYIWLSVAYADFLAARNAYNLAQDVNKTAVQQLEYLSSKHPHLMKHVMHQQICIMQAAKIGATPKKVPDEPSSCLILLNDVPINKTPVSPAYQSIKLQKSTLSVSTKAEYLETPVRIKPRKLVLPASDDEDDKENAEMQKKKNGTKENCIRKKKPETKQNSQVKVKIWKDTEEASVSSTRTLRTRRLLSESRANSAAKSSCPATRSKSTANQLR